ncbi:Trypanosoma vivax [Trypanosoma cruzi]|nr:Trypanosoma vivax [Trypanosoma cruzi]
MNAELQEVEQHADVLKEEVRQLSLELGDAKRRYFGAKHKNDLLRREQAVFRSTWGESSAIANIALAAASAHQQKQRLAGSGGGGSGKDSSNQQGVWLERPVGARRPCLWHTRTQMRRERMLQEARLVQALSSGAPAPNYPLQFRPQQRQFVGGGFALTR